IIMIASHEQLFESGGPFKLNAARELTRSVYGRPAILLPPFAHAVVILKCKPDRIHAGVTGGTDRIGTMLLHLLPHGKLPAVLSVGLQIRDVGRRRGRRGAEQ